MQEINQEMLLNDETSDNQILQSLDVSNDHDFVANTKCATISFAASVIATNEPLAENATSIDKRATLEYIEASQMHSITPADKTHCEAFINTVLYKVAETSLGNDVPFKILCMKMTGIKKGIVTYGLTVNCGDLEDISAFEDAASKLVNAYTQIDRVEFFDFQDGENHIEIDLDWQHVSNTVRAGILGVKADTSTDLHKKMAEMEQRAHALFLSLKQKEEIAAALEKDNARLREEARVEKNAKLQAESSDKLIIESRLAIDKLVQEAKTAVGSKDRKEKSPEVEKKAATPVKVSENSSGENENGDGKFAVRFADAWKRDKSAKKTEFVKEWKNKRSESGKTVPCVVPLTGINNRDVSGAAALINCCISGGFDIGAKDNMGGTMLYYIIKLKRWALLVSVAKKHRNVILEQFKNDKTSLETLVGDNPTIFFCDLKVMDAKLYEDIVRVFVSETPKKVVVANIVKKEGKTSSVGTQKTLDFSKPKPVAQAETSTPVTKMDFSTAPTMAMYVQKTQQEAVVSKGKKRDRSSPILETAKKRTKQDDDKLSDILKSLRNCVLYFNMSMFEQDEASDRLEVHTNDRTNDFGCYAGNLYRFLASLWNRCAFSTNRTESEDDVVKAILDYEPKCLDLVLHHDDTTYEKLPMVDITAFKIPKDMIDTATSVALERLVNSQRLLVHEVGDPQEFNTLYRVLRDLHNDADYKIRVERVKLLDPLWTVIEILVLEDLWGITKLRPETLVKYNLYHDLVDAIKERKESVKQYFAQ